MMEILGALLLISALIFAGWWLMGEHPHKGWAFTFVLSVIFVAVSLILQARVIEFTVQGIGTIKTAAKTASADANAISKLKMAGWVY